LYVKSARGIAPATRGLLTPRSGSDDWRHARPTPAGTRGGSSAHREGEGCRPEHQAGRRAAGVRRSRISHVGQTSLARRARLCARTMGKNISRPKQVTDWVARLEKLEQSPVQRSPTAACSCSQLGSGSRRMCQTFAPPIRWSGKSRPASVRFTAYLRQTEAGVARALIARLKAAEFLALRGGC